MKLAQLMGVIVVLVCVSLALGETAHRELPHRWIWVWRNFLLDDHVESTIQLCKQAAKLGYNGVVLMDTKFIGWDTLPDNYRSNVKRLCAALRELDLEVIACVMPMGRAKGILAHDQDLAAAMPVKNAPFVVRDGKIIPNDDSARIVNGSFEQFTDHQPAGWEVPKPAEATFIDKRVFFEGKSSLRIQNIANRNLERGNAKVIQTLKVEPFRYYHVSAAIKTRDFEAADTVNIHVSAPNAWLNYYRIKVAPTQDWKRVDITFNSLEHKEVKLMLDVWKGKGGTLWWDDVRIEPGGLVNAVRREGAPLRLTSEDGKTLYKEDRDFVGARDIMLGRVKYPGTFNVWHTRSVPTLTAESRIREGQRLRMSYYHTMIVNQKQVMCCMSEEKVYEILDWQIQRVKEIMEPDGYFMQHDEIRMHGWDESCARRNMTQGQILADNVKRCTAIIRKHEPTRPIYVWSDMFDPYHNAPKSGRYYLVKGDGPWYGSWEGLDKDVIVVNWHYRNRGGKADSRMASLKHLAARGHKQILAGYYGSLSNSITDWLNESTRVDGVIGVVFATWNDDYSDMEAYYKEVDAWLNRGAPGSRPLKGTEATLRMGEPAK